jgi:hypothetical protein
MSEQTFDYQFHPESQIHEYTLYRNGRDVVDAWFAHLGNVIGQAIEQEQSEIRLLVDVTAGGGRQPVGYMFQHAKMLKAKYPNAPMRRYVVIGDNEALGAIIRPLFGMLKDRLTFRYFIDRDRDKAIEWLTSTHKVKSLKNTA